MKSYLVIFLLANALSASSQLLSPAALDSVKVFTSLEKALKNPLEVYALDLSKQKLTELPNEIAQFDNLNKLIVNKNRIRVLPKFITELKYLQVLRMSRNKLKEFPNEICSMVHLDHLDLGNNSLKELPPCMSALTKLRILDLWGNEIGEFPDEMSECRSLRYVDMRTILLSEAEQENLFNLLPWAKFHFNQPCNCD